VQVRSNGAWSIERFVSLGLNQAINGIAVDENHLGGRLVWAAGQYGQVFVRRGRQPFGQVQLNWPPRTALCKGDRPLAEPQIDYGFFDAELEGSTLYLGLESCTALVALRTEDECLSLVPHGAVGPSEDAFQDVDRYEDELFVVTRYGRIYVAE
jgi:hypothetical protein